MPNERAARLAELVKSALECPPEGLEVFLNEGCGSDAELRAEVEVLLGQQEQIGHFLEEPALHHVAETLLNDEAGLTGEVIGQYEILSLIARGGMGEVYLARDRELQRDVALKLIRCGMNSREIARHFKREELLLASLNHPNIAQLYGGGVTRDGLPFFAMEYVEGKRLDEHCDERQLSISERLQLFRKVCSAVTYAHQHLVIHRDIKPANIRVTVEGEPKLLDFGIAKLLQEEGSLPHETLLTFAGAMTPEYASPEQVRGESIATTSDVYSLGVLLYKLLTGQSPYRTQTTRPNELACAITDKDPERPSTAVANNQQLEVSHHKSLKGDLDNVVLMALRKEPARRYTSVGQFSEDIRRYLEGLPVIASKDTFGYRAGKFARRNKAGVAAVALVLLVLLGGLVMTTWQTRIARQERDRARVAQDKAEVARKQAEQLNSFLQTLLSSANPSRLGRSVKVVEVLDAAEKNLDSELANDPELLAQAHTTMARAYDSLRESKPAIRHARAALDLMRRLHGKKDSAMGRAASVLGVILAEYHALAEAEPLLTEALSISRQAPLEAGQYASKTLSTLAFVLGRRGRAKEALPLAQEAVEISHNLHGESSAEAIDALNTLGSVQIDAGDVTGAEASFLRAVELYDQIPRLGASSIYARLNVVLALYLQGRIPEVRPVLEKAKEICERELGNDNDLYGAILWRLGTLDFMKGEYSSALPQLQRGLELIEPVFADDQIDVVHVRAMIGTALTRTGDPVAGEPLLRYALEKGTKVPSAYLALTVGSLEEVLGECLLAQYRYAEAEPLLLAGYKKLTTRLGEKDPMSVAAAHRLHQMYLAWGKPTEAARFAMEDNPKLIPVSSSRR